MVLNLFYFNKGNSSSIEKSLHPSCSSSRSSMSLTLCSSMSILFSVKLGMITTDLVHAVSDYKNHCWIFSQFSESTSGQVKFKNHIKELKNRSLVRFSKLRTITFFKYNASLVCKFKFFLIFSVLDQHLLLHYIPSKRCQLSSVKERNKQTNKTKQNKTKQTTHLMFI